MVGSVFSWARYTMLFFTSWLVIACGGGSQTSDRGPVIVFSPTPAPTPLFAPASEVTLQWGEDAFQFGILYRPLQYEGRLPVVVMIHGGCWISVFGLDFQTDLSAALANRGFAVWNIEYRSLGSGGTWPVLFQDVGAATDFLPLIADQYDLDVSQVLAMGHSAGGHLALWLASRGKIASDSVLYRESYVPLRGVVSLAGIADLRSRNSCGGQAKDIVDFFTITTQEYDRRLTNASPIEMLPTGVPSLLISGASDIIVPAALGASYVERAANGGDMSEHLILDNADHFELIDPRVIDVNLLVDGLTNLLNMSAP